MQYIVGVRSDPGRVRRHNEDSLLMGRRIWAVADGMGGQAAGEVASTMVTERLRVLDASGVLDQNALVHLIDATNAAMLQHGRTHPTAAGLGSTAAGIAAATIGGVPHWIVFNVGDSRVYRYADGTLTRETVDHNEAEELVAAGKLDPDMALSHPGRSVLTRALGSDPAPVPDIFVLPQRPDEVFLICSDGLTLEVPDHLLRDTLRDNPDPAEAAEQLIDRALEHGAHDNVTAIVVAVRPDDGADGPDQDSVETTIPRVRLRDIDG